MNEVSIYEPQNLEQAEKLASRIAVSEFCPKAYKNKPADILCCMMMGHDLGLSSMQSLQAIAVVNGNPSVYGKGAMALIMRHPEFAGIEETFERDSDNMPVATCTIKRLKPNGTLTSKTGTFGWDDAVRAGVAGRGTYQTFPKDMLMWRAKSRAFELFADCLFGLVVEPIQEPIQDPTPEPVDVTPKTKTEEIEILLGGKNGK
jgi:hypothetical protein